MLVVLVTCGLVVIVWSALDRGGVDPARVLSTSPFRLMTDSAPQAASQAAVATTSSVAGDPGLVEVCGLGWVEKRSDADPLDTSLLAEIPGIQASREALIERLRRSPDALARSAAIAADLNRGAAAGDAAHLLEPLAREATTTADPRVYALAFRLCSRAPTAGSCALLSTAQWARLDPGNGAPWLFMLGEVATGDDRALFDEALFRLGSASRLEDRLHAIAGTIVAEAGVSDPDLMAARELAMDLVARSQAPVSPSLQRLVTVCRGADLADANRRQICDAAAATLAERSDSMLLAVVGIGIGRRLDWPNERIVAVNALLLSLLDSWAAIPDAQPPLGESYSCNGVRHTLTRLGQLGRVGEVQAARDWIVASGRGLEAFASRARDEEERRRVFAAADEARRRVAASAAYASRPAD